MWLFRNSVFTQSTDSGSVQRKNSNPTLSLPDLFRQSIVVRVLCATVREAHVLRSTLAAPWIAGTSPAMTVLSMLNFLPQRAAMEEYPKGEGMLGVLRLLRASLDQTPPPGVAVLPHPPSPRLRWTRKAL
jgi:hypothetical protein